VDGPTTRQTGRPTPSMAEIIDGLNDLLQLDHDAVGAYKIAIDKLEDRDHANQITGFLREHERHIQTLNDLILELGGTPKHKPHATGPFKEALQSLGGLAGDKGVLIAWRTNELQVRTKYDTYASRAMLWPDHVKRAIDEFALDEERHYQWVTSVLQRMGVPTAEGLETGAATRLREAGTQMEQLAHRARSAAGAAATTARNRVAESLDAAADRLEHAVDERTDRGDRIDEVSHRVTSGMHSSAQYLRNADLDSVRVDLERSARQHPLRTLTLLFATGFVIGRLLR
jgi:rubrerythrin